MTFHVPRIHTTYANIPYPNGNIFVDNSCVEDTQEIQVAALLVIQARY